LKRTIPAPGPVKPAMARSVIDFPAPDGPRIAIRLLADRCASRSLKVPTARSRSKLTATGAAGGGGTGAGSVSGRRSRLGGRISAISSTTTATPSASAVGACVVGIPVDENCT